MTEFGVPPLENNPKLRAGLLGDTKSIPTSAHDDSPSGKSRRAGFFIDKSTSSETTRKGFEFGLSIPGSKKARAALAVVALSASIAATTSERAHDFIDNGAATLSLGLIDDATIDFNPGPFGIPYWRETNEFKTEFTSESLVEGTPKIVTTNTSATEKTELVSSSSLSTFGWAEDFTDTIGFGGVSNEQIHQLSNEINSLKDQGIKIERVEILGFASDEDYGPNCGIGTSSPESENSELAYGRSELVADVIEFSGLIDEDTQIIIGDGTEVVLSKAEQELYTEVANSEGISAASLCNVYNNNPDSLQPETLESLDSLLGDNRKVTVEMFGASPASTTPTTEVSECVTEDFLISRTGFRYSQETQWRKLSPDIGNLALVPLLALPFVAKRRREDATDKFQGSKINTVPPKTEAGLSGEAVSMKWASVIAAAAVAGNNVKAQTVPKEKPVETKQEPNQAEVPHKPVIINKGAEHESLKDKNTKEPKDRDLKSALWIIPVVGGAIIAGVLVSKCRTQLSLEEGGPSDVTLVAPEDPILIECNKVLTVVSKGQISSSNNVGVELVDASKVTHITVNLDED